MNDEDEQLLVKTIASLKRDQIELGCRVQMLQVAVSGLSLKQGIDPAKVYAALEAMSKRAVEKRLLGIGDTSPESAELLGIQDFLRAIDPDHGKQ